MMHRRHGPRFAAATIVGLLGLAACDGPVAPAVDDIALSRVGPGGARDAGGDSKGAANGMVAKPFGARLFTAGEGLTMDPACGDPPRFLNTQVGEGTATHLGRFSVRITFCMDVTDVLDDGLLTEGESLPYDDGFGTLIAANGDELYIEISGSVVPSNDPDFDFEFHDPFRFTGGTGRFAGASGEGTSDSFVTQAEDRTDHEWSGTLVLPRR